MTPRIVSRDQWLAERRALMEDEKALTRAREELARKRRELPRVEVDTPYTLSDKDGEYTLADLFAGKSQLIVYHFMFDKAWEQGCPSCSFWADNFDRNCVHLAARDVELVAVSEAAPPQLDAYKARMNWTFPWYSSGQSDFNEDFGVRFQDRDISSGAELYNFGTQAFPARHAPGISVFAKGGDGKIYHTYSVYSRGLDPFNAAYQYLDIVPNGRDEADLAYPQAWVRRRDSYDHV